MNKINLNFKLMILPIVIIIAMVILSFVFSQKIQNLKKQVDLIYFGNFIPVHKLHTIKEQYMDIINKKKLMIKTKKSILRDWNYYYKQYKSQDEKIIVEKINSQLINAFKINKRSSYNEVLKNISYLISKEVNSASKQRKQFVLKYEQMQNYLFYTQILIIVFVLILTALIVYQAIKQNKFLVLLNEQYKIEANTDGLTSLYNRKYFDTVFKDLTSISKQNNWKSVFVMIDIDFFKQYNDTYGHDAGDIALQEVAFVLDENFNREYEYTFRLGGEEFGIIIFDTNIKNVKLALNNLQTKIEALKIEHTASATSFLTLSMGVIFVDENNYNASVKELYTSADKKLYHSKENGRNQYAI
ncbi:MAG: GGDEF domain-containing protein [Arcobacteraceae bacterium]|nr:GGDEF domain-containing protein [Arcobacteraceae bacterium]